MRLSLVAIPISFLTPLAFGPPAVAAVFLFIPQLFGDGLGTIERIAVVSLRQTVTPDALLGRVTATVHVLFEGIAPLGALLGAALALAYGSRETLFIAVCGMVLARAWLLFSPARIAPSGDGRYWLVISHSSGTTWTHVCP